MASSFRAFNYALRPGKAAERKMLIESFRTLHPFCRVSEYEYIGFGSTSFVDFRLVHKELGIKKMHSIERDVSSKPRFDFNKPFSCLKMSYGESHDELPKLPWVGPSIVWLDYEGGLTKTVLADLATFANKAKVGSIIIVTMNTEQLGAAAAQEEDGTNTSGNDEIKALQEVVGSNQVPQEIQKGDFRGWGKADIYARILHAQLNGFVQKANNELDLARSKRSFCEQFAYFHYEDNAKMATVGWVLRDSKKASKDTFSHLNTLDFYVPTGSSAFKVEPPVFTHKELLHLESQVPLAKGKLKMPGVPESDLTKYARIYKYYPAYVEAEIR